MMRQEDACWRVSVHIMSYNAKQRLSSVVPASAARVPELLPAATASTPAQPGSAGSTLAQPWKNEEVGDGRDGREGTREVSITETACECRAARSCSCPAPAPRGLVAAARAEIAPVKSSKAPQVISYADPSSGAEERVWSEERKATGARSLTIHRAEKRSQQMPSSNRARPVGPA